MRSREEFYQDALICAMQGLISKVIEYSPKRVAVLAKEYAEELTLKVYGEELPIIKERRL